MSHPCICLYLSVCLSMTIYLSLIGQLLTRYSLSFTHRSSWSQSPIYKSSSHAVCSLLNSTVGLRVHLLPYELDLSFWPTGIKKLCYIYLHNCGAILLRSHLHQFGTDGEKLSWIILNCYLCFNQIPF